jgi:hypothetical protein
MLLAEQHKVIAGQDRCLSHQQLTLQWPQGTSALHIYESSNMLQHAQHAAVGILRLA